MEWANAKTKGLCAVHIKIIMDCRSFELFCRCGSEFL